MKRNYAVTFSNAGNILDYRIFEADDSNDGDGYVACEIAKSMLRDVGYLRPGDCIRVIEI